jgi:hypothetical protein
LCVAGCAGGVFHLRDGVVVAVDSPGSPGLELAMESMLDGTFAIAVGEIEGSHVDESVDWLRLPAAGGVHPEMLLAETGRRLAAVAALPFPLSPYRDRVMSVCEVDSVLTEERREIIAQVTGRRTVRDIAFALDRGLYAVTVEISRMLGDGLLEISPPAVSFSFSHWGLASLRPRVAAERTVGRGADQARPSEVEC